ncbi:MAG: hypothetical protein ABJE95_19215 [Byssovorax sp.]
MASRRVAKVSRSSFEPREIEEIEQKIRAAVALPLARIVKLCPADLDPDARARLIADLPTRGLERTAKLVRIPLAEQLRGLLAQGERIPLKLVPKRLKGATGPEIKAALAAQIKAGAAHVVVRGKNEVLVGGGERIVGRDGLARLATLQKALTELGKKVSAKGGPRAVLVEDLELLLEGLDGLIEPKSSDDSTLALREALARLGRAQHGLVSIPALVRALPGMRPAAIHAFLISEEKAGNVELRAETSVGTLLSAEDRSLCLDSSSGDLLSYALLIRGGPS